MAVYIDNAFVSGDWGKWTGGGHLQADSSAELHIFAAGLGLKRSWFQTRPGRPEMDHYDCTRGKRAQALALGAIDEDALTSTRRTLARLQRRQELASAAEASPSL
jgi:hypothetical protein